MPYPNEHAARIRDPGLFIPESFRSKDLKDGVRIIIGKLKTGESGMITQAYRFSVDKFTPEQARQWLKDNKVAFKKFEPAKEEKKDELAHYGVVGMRWGVRKAATNAVGRVKTHIKTATTPSSDHLKYKELRKKKIRNLSDDELKTLGERMRLVAGYRKSGEFQKKQIKAMSNEELRAGVSRGKLRRAIVKNISSMRFKEFVKSFKMSKEDADKLSARMYAEMAVKDLKYDDYKNAKKLFESFLEGSTPWIETPKMTELK